MAFWNAPLQTDRSRRAGLPGGFAHAFDLAPAQRTRCVSFSSPGRSARRCGDRNRYQPGPALVGNMGSESRFNYSVVGDAVNVASRVEGQAKPNGADALVAESVVLAASQFAYLEVGALDLRGKREKEKLFIWSATSTPRALRNSSRSRHVTRNSWPICAIPRWRVANSPMRQPQRAFVPDPERVLRATQRPHRDRSFGYSPLRDHIGAMGIEPQTRPCFESSSLRYA